VDIVAATQAMEAATVSFSLTITSQNSLSGNMPITKRLQFRILHTIRLCCSQVEGSSFIDTVLELHVYWANRTSKIASNSF